MLLIHEGQGSRGTTSNRVAVAMPPVEIATRNRPAPWAVKPNLKEAEGLLRRPLRGVATYGDVYKLTYVRGPSGIIVMFAEELNKS